MSDIDLALGRERL